jgi:hypothetical protein
MIDKVSLDVTTSGSDGSGAGNAITGIPIRGKLLAVRLDYHASAPATTDVTITEEETGQTLLTVTDNKTDGTYYPRALPVSATNAAITDSYVPRVVWGPLKVTVAQSNAHSPCVKAHFFIERG